MPHQCFFLCLNCACSVSRIYYSPQHFCSLINREVWNLKLSPSCVSQGREDSLSPAEVSWHHANVPSSVCDLSWFSHLPWVFRVCLCCTVCDLKISRIAQATQMRQWSCEPKARMPLSHSSGVKIDRFSPPSPPVWKDQVRRWWERPLHETLAELLPLRVPAP